MSLSGLMEKNIEYLKSLEHQSKNVLVTGLVNEKLVTIYGEIHNDIDENFYKQLQLTDHTVFVEHSTVYHELEPDAHEFFADAKGSEWIWYTYNLKKQKVTCVDTRIQNGFLSGHDEKEMRTMPLKELLECVEDVMYAAVQLKEKYSQIHEVFVGILSAMKRQYVMMILLSCSTLEHITIDDEQIDKDFILGATRNYLISNCIKIASLSVDMHIIDLVSQHTGDTPISIFVGINHAIRLSQFMNLKIVTDDTLLETYLERSSIWYDGEETSENEIIEQLKKKK